MRFLLALPVIAVVAFLIVGAVRGRVQVRSCCTVPADQDQRLVVPGTVVGRTDAPAGTPSQPVDATR